MPVVLPYLDAAGHADPRGELAFQAEPRGRHVPTPHCRAAPIHADLFRDNVMFATGHGRTLSLTGFFDFYLPASTAGCSTWR